MRIAHTYRRSRTLQKRKEKRLIIYNQKCIKLNPTYIVILTQRSHQIGPGCKGSQLGSHHLWYRAKKKKKFYEPLLFCVSLLKTPNQSKTLCDICRRLPPILSAFDVTSEFTALRALSGTQKSLLILNLHYHKSLTPPLLCNVNDSPCNVKKYPFDKSPTGCAPPPKQQLLVHFQQS